MEITTKPSTWHDDDKGQVSGILVTGSFVDSGEELDLDERVGLESLITEPDIATPDNATKSIKRQIALHKKQEFKAAQQRAYQARQVQVMSKLEAFIDQAIDARPEIDLSNFQPGQTVEINKNRKTRKVSFIRRYASA